MHTPHTHRGPTAGLAVGVSCLAIPLTGGVSLSLCRAECCSDPSQKHLGYLPPHLAGGDKIIPHGLKMSFSLHTDTGGLMEHLVQGGTIRMWFQHVNIGSFSLSFSLFMYKHIS